jgi:hypothetical protein
MRSRHKHRLLALVVGMMLAAGALSGCASSDEPTLASAVAKSGVAEGVVDSLKAADDAAEVQELREAAPQSRQEREEARDQHEQSQMEAEPTDGGEAGPAPDSEGEGEEG